MKYNTTAKLYYNHLLHTLETYAQTQNIAINYKKLKVTYSNMLYRTESIDTQKDANLYRAIFVFSLVKVHPELTPKQIDEWIELYTHSKAFEKKYKAIDPFSKKVQEHTYKQSLISQKSTRMMDWTYLYKKGTNEFFITFSRCGVYQLAIKENLQDYVPCLCKIEHRILELQQGKIYQNQSLASGGFCCDYHVVKREGNNSNN